MVKVSIDNKMYEGNVVEVTNCGVVKKIIYANSDGDSGEGYIFSDKQKLKEDLLKRYEGLGDTLYNVEEEMRKIEEEIDKL
jgi:hypothetical protein